MKLVDEICDREVVKKRSKAAIDPYRQAPVERLEIDLRFEKSVYLSRLPRMKCTNDSIRYIHISDIAFFLRSIRMVAKVP